MGTIEPVSLETRVKRTYTISEAVELMKELDRHPTNTDIKWVDSKTGKPVSIGFNR